MAPVARAISGAAGTTGFALATASLVDGPASPISGTAALTLELVSVGFGAVSVAADIETNDGTDAGIDATSTAFAAVAPAMKGANAAVGFGDDVVRAVGWNGDLGAFALWVSGSINSFIHGGN